MSKKNNRAKYRLCRREGINLFGNEKFDGLKKKNYPPGIHGPKGSFSKQSEYGRQLRAKQRLRRLYGVTERQLRNYYKKAAKKKEATGIALLKELEVRLDNVLYRTGLVKSRTQARQMISHGHFKLNGKKMNIRSYQVQVGDSFVLKDRLKDSPLYQDIKDRKATPAPWLKIDQKNFQAEMTRELEESDLEKAIQINLVVEYYSK